MRGPTATRVPARTRLAGTVWGANEGVAHGMFTRKEARGRCRAGCKCGAIFRGKRDDLDRSERGRREKSEILQSESQTRSTASSHATRVSGA